MSTYNNMKLLILGATKMEIEIIKAAQRMCAYVIVTDNHVNWAEAPAKYEADEAWNVSWSDLEELARLCRENKIDGCMAGFSEKRVFFATELSKMIGKPFYASEADLNRIFDKIQFKNACIEAGIRVPRRFTSTENIEFPVIIKPSDNGGSRGISICYEKEEFDAAYQRALQASDNGTAVVEEYLRSDEVMVYFSVYEGEVKLSAMCDRLMEQFDKGITQLPVGYFYPSKHLEVFEKYNLEKYKKLIRLLNIKNGLIAFQAFVIGEDVIPFDPTYRLDGTMAYHFTEKATGVNVLNSLIMKSLTGNFGDSKTASSENAYFKDSAFQLPILLRNGTITSVSGVEAVKQMKDVIFIYQGHEVGETMERPSDFSQIFCRIFLYADRKTHILKDIQTIFDTIEIKDENGESMILGRYIDYAERFK